MSKLNREQIIYFNSFIKGLKDNDKLNLCEECHSKIGCGNNHDKYLEDTGTCSICGKSTDVVNCAISNEVINQKIEPQVYWKNGKKTIEKD